MKSLASILCIWFVASCAAMAADSVVTDTQTYTKPSIAMPGYLETITDQYFKTRITRITNSGGTSESVVWGNRCRHHYSLDQAWNADQSLLMVYNNDDNNLFSPSYLILDGGSYQYLYGLDFSPWQVRWSTTDPNTLLYTYRNVLARYNVRTKVHTVLHTFTEYDTTNGIDIGSKGNFSHDNNWVAFCAKNIATGNFEVFAYEIANNIKHATKSVGTKKPAWWSISPSGTYVVIFWSDEISDVYSREMILVRTLPSNISHYDLGLDSGGTDIAIGTYKPDDATSPSPGDTIKIPLASGDAVICTSQGWAGHTSARCYDNIGWASVSMDDTGGYGCYNAEIVVVEATGNGTVRRFGHDHNYNTDYYNEEQGAISPDASRVVFGSDWGQSSGRPVNAYVTDARHLLPYLTRYAYAPHPTNGSYNADPADPYTLTWSAGLYAVSHDVYFGTSYSAVANATHQSAEFKGNQAGTFYDTGSLSSNTTYYWCIDEIDANSTVTYGSVWSFKTNRGERPIYFDSFENWLRSEWTYSGENVFIADAPERAGKAIRIKNANWAQVQASTVGYTDIHVKYARKTINLSGDNNLVVEWSTNGSTWYNLETTTDTSWADEDMACASGANDNIGFRVRFRVNGSLQGHEGWIDGVTIDGVRISTPDTTAPTPNPMTWSSVPVATGASSIRMTATTGLDISGVQYYFDCTAGAGGHDSGWQTSPTYEDTGLNASTTYTYRVKARDLSNNLNETSYSTSLQATTTSASDVTAPTPNPMTWSSVPAATSSTTIAMTATTASDTSGVQYYFQNVTAGDHDSGWQTSPSYTDSGLSPSTTYTYKVKARDLSANLNETAYSTTGNATTQAGAADTTAPTPNPTTWSSVPAAASSTSISMTATTASDASGVEYFFNCLTAGGHDSSWQSSASYTDTGLQPSTAYSYQVKVRDLSENYNETAYSTTKSATTQAAGGSQTTLFTDDFTTNNFATNWTVSNGSYAYRASSGGNPGYCMRLKGDPTQSHWGYHIQSTVGYGNVRVKYDRKLSNLVSGEYLYVEWSTDGDNWTVLEATQDTSYTSMDLVCGSGAGNSSGFRIRVRSNIASSSHYAFVDNIQVVGENAGTSDTTPPSPNPMTWFAVPSAISSTSITMTATTATDANSVEYFFHNVTDNNHDSGWQSASVYTDTGLTPGTTYTYQVKARDMSPNHNETSYSTSASATTDQEASGSETTLFTDDFETSNFATNWSVNNANVFRASSGGNPAYCMKFKGYISANYWAEHSESTVGYSNIHVKYDRRVTSALAGEYLYAEWSTDGNTWYELEATQDTSYATADLTCPAGANNNAGFRIRFRTNLGSTSRYAYVDNVEIYAEGGADTTAPTPNPMTWASVPAAASSSSISMTATTASDASGVEYFFNNLTIGGHDSGWQSSPTYTDTGLNPSTNYTYRVKARDLSANYNETSYSTSQQATTQSDGSAVLFSDDFETANFATNWTVNDGIYVFRGTSGGNPTCCMKFKGGGTADNRGQHSQSTVGRTNIHVKYDRRLSTVYPGEYLYVEWSTNGTTWYLLESTQDTTYASKDFICSSGANNNAGFRVRFRTNQASTSRNVFVDNVQITGQ